MLQRRIDDHAPPSREAMREAQDIFFKHLRRVGLMHTEQRDTILRTFLDTRDHLSTDELFRLVKKRDAKIGFTTVYRTLKLLAECGLASAVPFPDGTARYEHQFNRRSHHHMVCTECDASVEFFSPEVGKLEEEIGHVRPDRANPIAGGMQRGGIGGNIEGRIVWAVGNKRQSHQNGRRHADKADQFIETMILSWS